MQIADLQVNRADVRLLWQTLWRTDTIELWNVRHFRNHLFTP